MFYIYLLEGSESITIESTWFSTWSYKIMTWLGVGFGNIIGLEESHTKTYIIDENLRYGPIS